MWRDDLGSWRAELATAFDELRRADQLLRDHAEALCRHADDLAVADRAIRAHEQTLAEPGVSVRQPFGRQAAGHAARAANGHPHLRDAHERLKACHHTLIARVARLATAADGPERRHS
jgi:hypothetical protein